MITWIVLTGVVAIWLHQLMNGLDGLRLFSGLCLHRINGLFGVGSIKLIDTKHTLLGPVCPINGSLKDHNPGGNAVDAEDSGCEGFSSQSYCEAQEEHGCKASV